MKNDRYRNREIDFWDDTDPMAIISRVNTFLRTKMKAIPSDWRDMSEEEAETRCADLHGGKVPRDLQRLRIHFWFEYSKFDYKSNSQVRAGKINLPAIYGPVCSKARFEKLVSNSYNLAYILTPIADIEEAMEQMLYFAVREMDEIMHMPVRNKKGQLDFRLMNMKMKIFEKLHDRKFGMATQRVETKNLNVNADVLDATPKSFEDIEREIAELRAGQSHTSEKTLNQALRDVSSETERTVEAITITKEED